MLFIRKLFKGIAMIFGTLFLGMVAVAIIEIANEDGSKATANPPEDAKAVARSCTTCNYTMDDSMAVLAAHDLVKHKLREPGSAIWDQQHSWTDTPNVVVARTADGGIRAVCGSVSAKNGFGGYTGDQAYIVSLEKDILRLNPSDEEFRDLCL